MNQHLLINIGSFGYFSTDPLDFFVTPRLRARSRIVKSGQGTGSLLRRMRVAKQRKPVAGRMSQDVEGAFQILLHQRQLPAADADSRNFFYGAYEVRIFVQFYQRIRVWPPAHAGETNHPEGGQVPM